MASCNKANLGCAGAFIWILAWSFAYFPATAGDPDKSRAEGLREVQGNFHTNGGGKDLLGFWWFFAAGGAGVTFSGKEQVPGFVNDLPRDPPA
jgi:hypothetical protein